MNPKAFYKLVRSNLKKGPGPRVIASAQGPWFMVDGKRKLNFCSSHYLGFAVDKRLKKASIEGAKKYGLGTGYRTLAGTNVLNTKLEAALAKFKGADDAIVLPSGYLANMAAIQTIMGKEDIVVSDELNHASIIDAIRLAGIKNKFIYKHGDVGDLERILKQVQNDFFPHRCDGDTSGGGSKADSSEVKEEREPLVLIVTDGVFSMDGDLAPLPDIVRLARKYGALTMVDDAHGEGVLGKGGRGIVDHFGLHAEGPEGTRRSKVDIEMGTLSKAFSVIGGFITGRAELIKYYKQNARQFMFTSAMTAPDTAALLEAIKILQESDHLVKKLWENTKMLKAELVKLGFDIGKSKTPITPIMLGAEELAVKYAGKLYDRGIFASAIVFPMVARGAARIRLIPSASHSKRDIDFALKQIERVGRDLGVI